MFNKSVIVGVSITPEVGLEVAQVDFATQTVLKYGVRKLEYNSVRQEISDLDLFKDALEDLLQELAIPVGTHIVLNIPAAAFCVKDYPAALSDMEISNALEDSLAEHAIFKDIEPAISAVKIPSASIQFNKFAYTVAQKQMLIEIALTIKSLGYKLYAIDTSVNSTLNALMYKQRIDVNDDINWLLLIVENSFCRVLSMNGRDYIDSSEERISIGEVLSDAENYATVVAAVSPILKNIPSKYLCVVSNTNVISAEVLASKLTYSAPIIYQEANCYAKEAFLDRAPEVDSTNSSIHMSLGVIGAAIYKDFEKYTNAHFNLFNDSLGDVYFSEQPPKLVIAGHTIIFTNELLLTLFIVLGSILIVIIAFLFIFLSAQISSNKVTEAELDSKIEQIQKFLKENENISTELFDEGDEIRTGLEHNKAIYSYFTIVGTEIHKKLWLTHLKFGNKTTIEGQADNLESVYAFFRSIKDYDPDSDIKLQKLGLASKSSIANSDMEELNTDSILTSLNADFYEFAISDDPNLNKKDSDNKKTSAQPDDLLPGLEPIKESN